jgi:hypothetical protein
LGFVVESGWGAGMMQGLSLYGIFAWEHAGLMYTIVLVQRYGVMACIDDSTI